MDAGFEPGRPLSVAAQSMTQRLREWTLAASRQWGKARGDGAPRSVRADQGTDRQPAAMIKPSMHERVALTCRKQEWP